MAPLAIADAARRQLIVPVARAVPAVVVSRDVRIAVFGTLLVLAALVLTSTAPIWVLGLGPIVWGVPHVLADIRYLVVRPRLHQRHAVAAAIAGGIVLSVVAGLRGALIGAALAVVLTRGSLLRRGLVLGAIGALFALATHLGTLADVGFAHLHNLIAVGFFVLWRRRDRRLWAIPVAAFVAGAVLILAGVVAPRFTAPVGTVDLFTLEDALAPGVSERMARALVLLYAFGQSVHYVVWLGMIPAESRRRSTPPSFRQAARAIRADLGRWVLGAAALGMLVFAVWAFEDLAEARDAYLRAAFFHGYLELGVLFVFVAEGLRPSAPLAPSRS